MRTIRLQLESFSDEDLELILQLKGAEIVTILCDELGSKRKRNRITKTLKEKLPKLVRISINDEVERLDEETGTWRVDA